jgi:hypothetical protein
VRREIVKRRVGPALYQVTEPGDQIMAGTLATTGPSAIWDLLLGLPVLAGTVASATGLFGSFDPALLIGPFLVFVPFLLAWPLRLRRKPVFVAVTQRQFICYRMSRLGNEPSRLLFSAPPAAVRLRFVNSWMLNWESVRYSGPGAGGRGLRLNVRGPWRSDLHEALAALQAGGAAVDGPPPGRPTLKPGFPVGTDTPA